MHRPLSKYNNRMKTSENIQIWMDLVQRRDHSRQLYCFSIREQKRRSGLGSRITRTYLPGHEEMLLYIML